VLTRLLHAISSLKEAAGKWERTNNAGDLLEVPAHRKGIDEQCVRVYKKRL